MKKEIFKIIILIMSGIMIGFFIGYVVGDIIDVYAQAPYEIYESGSLEGKEEVVYHILGNGVSYKVNF